MTPREHAKEIARVAAKLIITKYNAGQIENGGKLWTKPGLIDMAIEEAIDQVIYLLTLKEQLEHPEMVNPLARDNN